MLLGMFGLMAVAGVSQADEAQTKLPPPKKVTATTETVTDFSVRAQGKEDMIRAFGSAFADQGYYRVYRGDGTAALAMVDDVDVSLGKYIHHTNRYVALGQFDDPIVQDAATQERAKMIFGYLDFNEKDKYYIERISSSDPGLENYSKLVVAVIPETRESCVIVTDKLPVFGAVIARATARPENVMSADCRRVKEGDKSPFGDKKVDIVVLGKLGDAPAP
jgi:hypothetical protein